MPFDSVTLDQLEFQAARFKAAQHGTEKTIPDRKEAALIMRRIDDILDRRPRTYRVGIDGELVWESESSWIQDQVLPGETIAVNATGQAEIVLSNPREDS